MKTIAVIGLGIMGLGIADNFLKNGHKVIIWNRTADKAKGLVSRGATLASSIKDAVEQSDIIFEVTANNQSSKEIWLGDDGILNNAKPGQYLITCATLSVDWIDELTQKAKSKQLTFFDMPMTGGRIGAETGELILLVGGSKEKLEELDDLKAIAKEVKYFGPEGSGTRYKLILNMLQAIHIAGLGEALRLAKKVGLDENLVGDALAERPGGTTTNLAWRDYQNEPDPINFSVEWIAKDLDYARQAATGINHPFLDDVITQYKKAFREGFSQSDWTKINKL